MPGAFQAENSIECKTKMGLRGVEPLTSRLSGGRSNRS